VVHPVRRWPVPGWQAKEILQISLFRPSDEPSLIGNIFSNFFAPLYLLSLDNLMTCLSPTQKVVMIVSVNHDVHVLRGKVYTATGVMGSFWIILFQVSLGCNLSNCLDRCIVNRTPCQCSVLNWFFWCYSGQYLYWASKDIPDNPLERINNVEFLYERQFHPNVGSAVMATSYALFCYLAHNDMKNSVPIMKFITSQRNHMMGWSSTSVRMSDYAHFGL